MRLVRLSPLLLVLVLASLPAQGQDDLLAPLAPAGKKAPKKKKAATAKRPPKHSPRAAEQADDADVLAPLVAKTQLSVKVSGASRAKLLVDGKELATLPSDPVDVAPGPHRVLVRRPGFGDEVRDLSIDEGKKVELSVVLEPLTGVLTVLANVPAAKVYVDGKFEGSVPLRELLLVPGLHEVKISAEGYTAEVSRVIAKAGRDYTINAELSRGSGSREVASADRPERTRLTPEADALEPTPLVATRAPEVSPGAPAWYQRWYVWAGVGAVAVGAVATGMVVANSGPDLSRDPASVCGGTLRRRARAWRALTGGRRASGGVLSVVTGSAGLTRSLPPKVVLAAALARLDAQEQV